MTSPSSLLDEYNPLDPETLADPYRYLRALRQEAPVYHCPKTGLYIVSTYELVREVLSNDALYSSRFAPAMGGAGQPDEIREIQQQGYPVVDTMLTADNPEHKRYRGMVNKAFTPRRIDVIAPIIEKISADLVDAFVDDGKVEILSQFSVSLPLTVISDQLGVPRRDLARFKRWTDGFVAQLGGMATAEGAVEAARRILEYQHYFAERLDEAREAPREDIISDLVQARVEGEAPLDVTESLSIIQQLLVAGNETTADAIAEGCMLLARHPEQQEVARSDPERIPNLVDEVLRLSSPTANMWRVAKEDAVLGGVEIPAGAFVLVSYSSANRDETQFEDPDRFDIERKNAREQIAFGRGVHVCVGAPLARREMEIGFRDLLTRLGPFSIDPEAEAPRHRPNILLHGLASLHLLFDATR